MLFSNTEYNLFLLFTYIGINHQPKFKASCVVRITMFFVSKNVSLKLILFNNLQFFKLNICQKKCQKSPQNSEDFYCSYP